MISDHGDRQLRVLKKFFLLVAAMEASTGFVEEILNLAVVLNLDFESTN
jgi:hypothetical protein